MVVVPNCADYLHLRPFLQVVVPKFADYLHPAGQGIEGGGVKGT